MALYRDFELTDDHAFNIFNALCYCKKHNEKELIFEKKTYELYQEKASESLLCISNHDVYGLKRIAFLIEEMDNFTVDGNGADFLIHGSMIPFAVKKSKNICLKNFSVNVDQTMLMEATVTDCGSDYCDIAVNNNAGYCVSDKKLTLHNDTGDSAALSWMCIRSRGESNAFVPESQDLYYSDIKNVSFEIIGDKKLRMNNLPKKADKDFHVILGGSERYGCSIFCADSKDIKICNVTLYRSYGMGVVGQKSENMEIDALTVKAPDGGILSLNADATHFINCKGLIKVENSRFSEQMDDALNIHGVFTKIVDKTKDCLLVKYMHRQAKGINTYESGNEISIVDPESLISKGVYEVSGVENVNLNYTKIYVKGGTENIDVNDLVEDLTWSCGLVFANNRVENNRARGILIAAKGNVLIKNNYFNTPGTAILFESNGTHWFESGGTTSVTIEGNTFENCKYARSAWGKSVIDVVKRERFDEGRYYHKYIKISDNLFKNNTAKLICADNVEKLIIKDNTVDGREYADSVKIKNCGEVVCDEKL